MEVGAQLQRDDCDEITSRNKNVGVESKTDQIGKTDRITAASEPTSTKNGDIRHENSTEEESGAEKSVAFGVGEAFYEDAKTYWSGIEPTVDGMLGGFERVDASDVRGSRDYLHSMFHIRPAPKRRYALDCGAGIGRVTKRVLLSEYDKVDAVEQDPTFASKIREFVGNSPKLGEVFIQGLQDFTPAVGKYDLIWTQWVLGHLTDTDFIAFFKRCAKGLNKNGIIIIKENVSPSPVVEIDERDSSFTRPIMIIKMLLIRSGMRILRVSLQTNFPAGLLPVYMLTVKPK